MTGIESDMWVTFESFARELFAMNRAAARAWPQGPDLRLQTDFLYPVCVLYGVRLRDWRSQL